MSSARPDRMDSPHRRQPPAVTAEMERQLAPAAGSAQAADRQVRSIATSDATVVLTTYDPRRWLLLEAAVQSIIAQHDGPRRLVICVDRNEELLNRARRAWPEVTVVPNKSERGASGARNTGAEYADTRFIAFLDDDVHARDGWLSRLLEPFADPTVVGTGGGVVPHWETRRPSWFPEEFDWVVGASYRGMPTIRRRVRNVWAENMAVRTDVFNSVGGFRTGFGKIGSVSRPEDTDLCIRMSGHAARAHWVYVPEARIDHYVPAERASISFFLRRSYNEGRGKVEMARLLGSRKSLWDEADYLRRTLPAGFWAGLKLAVRHHDMNGLLKAGAIVAGATAAGAGAIGVIYHPKRGLAISQPANHEDNATRI
jgi:glucosyl-dolichyl phosphate glucuronosyltransferase